MTIDRHNFQQTLNQILQRKLNKKLDFLKSIHLFKSMSRTLLVKLDYCFVKKKYAKGDIVYKSDEPTKKLVIIQMGTFEQYSARTAAHLTDTGLKR